MITKQTLILTEPELDNLMDSKEGLDFWGARNLGWKKLAAEHPELLKKGALDKDGKQTWAVDTFMKVVNSAAMASEQMQKNMYATQDGGVPEWIGSKLELTNKSSVDKTTLLKARYADEKYQNYFESAYNDKDKTKIANIKNKWDDFVGSVVNSDQGKQLFNGQNGALSTSDLTEAHDKIAALPEATATQRKDKAKLMSDFRLFLVSPDVYNMLNPVKQQQQPDNGGKSQGGFQKTQSTPLR
jgi:hypothetical protein